MILVYIGVEDYQDPFNRFIAKSGDLVEFTDEEALEILLNQEDAEIRQWEEYVEPEEV